MVAGRRIQIVLATFVFCTLAADVSQAVQPDEMLADANLEQRARDLSAGLRCMVCQNQSIDDSDAPLARDLRLLVRQRLKAGDSDEEVQNYLVSRYGQFVLLRPRFEWETALLWGTPLLLLGTGVVLLSRTARRIGDKPESAPLSIGEEARLSALLKEARIPPRVDR